MTDRFEQIPIQTGEQPAKTAKSTRGRKRRIVIAVVTLLLILLSVIAWLFFLYGDYTPRGGWFYEQSAEEIQEAIDHEVEDGYFNMTINSSVPVYEGTTALAGIQNIESNKFDCKVTITLENGTIVYESGGLQPGQELKTVQLNQPLDPGEYTAVALFEIYDQDEAHTKAGQTASKITLISQ